MLPVTIPATVAPEVDQFLSASGLRDAYEQLFGHALQTVPQLRSIEVTFHPYCGDSCEEFVAFHAFSAAPPDVRHEAADAWMMWAITRFPYEVNCHFILFVVSEVADAR